MRVSALHFQTKEHRSRSALLFGGVAQIGTGEWKFCRLLPYHLATTPYLLFRKNKALNYSGFSAFSGAEYEARTRYLNLGKVALYQMS